MRPVQSIDAQATADAVLSELAGRGTHARRSHRATRLLIGALVTTLVWAATAVALQVHVNRERDRLMALTKASEELHELDGIGWRVSLGQLEGQAATAAAEHHWATMRAELERSGSPAVVDRLGQTEHTIAGQMAGLVNPSKAVDPKAAGLLADLLLKLDEPLEAARDRVAEHVRSSRRTATLHTLGGGLIALVLVALLMLAYRRSARAAAALAGLAARAEGQRDALAASERRVRALVEHASDCVVVVAADGRVSYATDSLHALIGHHPAEAIGRGIGTVLAGRDAHRLIALLNATEAVAGPLHAEATLRHRDGDPVDVEVRIADRRDDPEVLGLVVTLRDIGEKRRLQRELQAAEVRDAGTGLANRARFETWIADALAAGGDEPALAVVVVDLNDFQAVNESLGYAAGDACLTECAQRLRAVAGEHGRLARLAGDGFGLLVERVTAPEIAQRAARALLDALAAPVQLPEGEVPLTASAGVALAAPGGSAQDLVRAADTAVHAATLRGPGHIELFAAAMHVRARRRLELRSALSRALELDQLHLAYQPIVDAQTGEPVAYEALLRWNLDRRPVSPADFIPVAEASGLIVPIGERVLERACAEVAAFPNPHGCTPHVSVNVSAVQLRSRDFVAAVRRALERSGLPARSLIIELTESAVLDDMPGVRATLEATRALGVRIALDDFGTGWSSLATLASLPIDFLKLDRSFVAAMDDSPAHEALLGGVVSMARRIGIPTVAEGVETEAQLGCLRALGADFAQGYHLGRPGPLDPAEAAIIAYR